MFADATNAPIITALRAVRHSKLVEAMKVTQTAKAALLDMHGREGRRKKGARSAVVQRSNAPGLARAANA
jgi:hypothetical protein